MTINEPVAREIIDCFWKFYRKEHPAWNPNSTIQEVITRLPLLWQEMAHPSRDESIHSITISHFSPFRTEIVAIAEMIKQLPDPGVVWDLGCGSGFLGSLLALEQLDVIGLDDESYKQPQITNLGAGTTFSKRIARLDDVEEDVDVVFCAWMSPGLNLTPAIVERKPRIIIHMFSPDCQGDGSPTTGTREAYQIPEGYEYLESWRVTRPQDFFLTLNEIHADLPIQKCSPTTRVGLVLRRTDVTGIKPVSPCGLRAFYDWDKERAWLNRVWNARDGSQFSVNLP